MGKISRVIRYLTYDEIVGINLRSIKNINGSPKISTILNQNSLHYIIEHVKNDDLIPHILEKAANYAFHIINGHIFIDGNKRTGMKCLLYFLRINNVYEEKSIKNEEIVNIGFGIAKREIDLKEIFNWLQEHFTIS